MDEIKSAAPYKVLCLIRTHSKHERNGAAVQLIQWNFPHADAAGLGCYVNASKLGHQLYRKWWFVDVGEMTLDLDGYESGEWMGVQRLDRYA